MNKHIFWIASYPKSGNTLLRAIIGSLFFTNNGNFHFDLLKKIVTFDEISRLKFSKILNSKDITSMNQFDRNELIYNNIGVLQRKENLGFKEDFAFFKTHFSANYKHKKFVIKNNTRGIIYIVRDPRDICISWAKHSDINLQSSINFLLNNLSYIKWTDVDNQINFPRDLPVYLSSWDNHVVSWLEVSNEIPKLIIKFEDLINDKEKAIKSIIEFFYNNYNLKILNEDVKINNIMKTTDFMFLQNQEKLKGFRESVNKQFFSVGKKNQWKNKLNEFQLKQMEEKFDKVMKIFNYKLGVEF